MSSIRYGEGFSSEEFLALANHVWPGEYDVGRLEDALARTINIGAWDGGRLIGRVRVLSDGYLFATVPEVLVETSYRRRGIGRELMRRALERSPH